MCVPDRPDSVLRRAAPADAAALVALRVDLSLQHLLMANPDPERSVDPLTDTTAWLARREAQGWFRVIDDGQGAQGFAQIAEIHRRNRFGWLGLALLPGARGRGLGARALAEAEAAASDTLGLHKLLLQVRADNAAALALYDRAGWRMVGTLLGHYDDGARRHDALILEKTIA